MVKQWLGSGLLALCLLGVSVEPAIGKMPFKKDEAIKKRDSLDKQFKDIKKREDEAANKIVKAYDKTFKLADKIDKYNNDVEKFNGMADGQYKARYIDGSSFYDKLCKKMDAYNKKIEDRKKKALAKKEKREAIEHKK